jgi:hypothetical protein
MDLYDDSGFFNRVLDSDTVGTRVSALAYRNTLSDVVSVVVRIRLQSSTSSPSTVNYDLSIVCELCLSGVWRSLVDEDAPPRELRYPVLTRADRTLEYRIQWGGMSRRRQADTLCNMDTLICPGGVTRVSNGDCLFAQCTGLPTYGCVRDWRAWLTLLSASTAIVDVALWQNIANTRTLCGASWLSWLGNTDPVSNFQTLVRQYLAARLNMLAGADVSSVYNIMVQASLLLRQHCPLANNVHAFWSMSDSDLAWLLTSPLTQFNYANGGSSGPSLCSATGSIRFGREGNLNSLRDLPLPTAAPSPGSSPSGSLTPVPVSQLGPSIVVALGSRWFMTLVPQSGDSWRQLGFALNASWMQQASPFSYGESKLAGVGYVFPSIPGDQYYRQEFTFSDQQLAQTLSATLRVASDDNADVWINNVLVLDDSGDHEYSYWNQVVLVNRTVLRVGINVVTAINHNTLPSSDTVFEAELELNYSSSIVANVPPPAPAPTTRAPSPQPQPSPTTRSPTPSPSTPRPLSPTPPTPPTPMPTMMPTSCFLDSQSALGFVPQPIQGMPLNQSFVIGTLVHYNCPIVGGYVSEVELTIPIRFLSGVFDGSARFKLELHETSNGAVASDCPYPSTMPCSDRLQWASLTTPDSFVVGNRRFALSLLGFSRNADPSRFALVSQFYSEERQSNIAYLVATLKEAPLCDVAFDVCNVCGGDGSTCAPLGCDGVRGSGLVYDRCGVCNGDNRCVDCAGVLFGTRRYDRCNVCNGDGQSCVDCRSVLFGTARYDQCDVCGGNGVSCLDCARVPFGTKVIDVCGVCGGNGSCTLTYDCFGVLNGTARLDVCGICGGNGRSCVDCHGVVNGTAVVDWCNVCDGDGSSCVDCAGMRNGTQVRDKCGVCGGNDSTCRGCDGVPLSGYVYDPCGVCQRQLPDGSFASLSCVSGCDRRPFAPYKTIDRCGVCGGTNACLDCAGTPHGTVRYDRCDVCGGDGTRCVDCAGVPFGDAAYNICGECVLGGANRRRQPTERPLESCITGCDLMPWSTKVYDVCGVCGGDGKSCLDCRLVPHGTTRYDVCGVCGGDNHSCRDCMGVVNGPARYDPCGVCNGNSSTCRDCLGVVNGRNAYDKCGVCGGANRCLDCNGTPHGDAVYNVCDVCVGARARKRVVECLDCAGVPFGTRKYDACDVCGGNNSTCLHTEAPISPAPASTVTPRTEAPEEPSTLSTTTTLTTTATSTTTAATTTTTTTSMSTSGASSSVAPTSASVADTVGTPDNGAIRGGLTGTGIDVDDGANSSSSGAIAGAVIGTLLGLALLGGGVLTALWLRRRSLRAPKSVDNNPVFEEGIGDEEL